MHRLSCARRGGLLVFVCAFATFAVALSRVTVAVAGVAGADVVVGCDAHVAWPFATLGICPSDPFAVRWVAPGRSGAVGGITKPARVRLVVGFGRHLSARARLILVRRLGLKLLQTLPRLRAVVVSLPAASARTTLARLAGSPDVAYAERDRTVRATSAPNDPYFINDAPNLFGGCAHYLDCWPYQTADLPAAWNVTTGSSTVIVAVLDSGVDSAQPDLQGAVLTGCNLVSGTVTDGVCSNTNTEDDTLQFLPPVGDNPPEPFYAYSHGTEVAGVIAARINNGIGIPGVCGQCKILPVKVADQYGNGSNPNIALGIIWAADNGARIINLSMAGGYPDPLFRDAISYAIGKGVLVVAGAGNGSSNSPSAYPGGYPAAFTAFPDANGGAPITSGLIAVAATDGGKDIYSFSNYGSWVTVSAPGATTGVKRDGTFNDQQFAFGGTSAAAPFVAGTAALLLSYDPSLTPAQLQADISSSATPTRERTLNNGSSVSCSVDPCSQYGALDAYGALVAAGYTPPPVAPSNSDAPTLSGSAVDGQTLTGSQGSWTGSATISYSYAWARCDSASDNCSATGTTSTDYVLSAADVSHTLQFTVTATNDVGSVSASVTSAVVAALGPSVVSGPTISGGATPTLGDLLTASPGSWSGTATIGYADQWQSSADGTSGWANISAATASSHTVDTNDQDNYLRVRVTGTNGGGSAVAYSAASGQVVFAPVNAVLPTVSGTLRAGQTLAAATGSWTGSAASYAYRWQGSGDGTSGWSDISGATGASYNIQIADVGNYLRVVVSSSNSAGSASAHSAASAQVRAALVTPSLTLLPEISGSATVGSVLTASSGNWTGSPSSYSYQWSSSTDGSSYTDIFGANDSSYIVQSADLGDYLRVTVTARTDSGGIAAADSGPTGQVVSAGTAGGGGGGGGGGGAAPDFKLLLSSDQPTAVEGSQIIWRLTISDEYGTAAASGVNVTITLPPGLAFRQAGTDRGPGCAPSGQTVVCNLDYIAPGLDGHIILWTQVNAAGDQTLTATVRHNGPEANPADDQSSLTVPAPTTTIPPTIVAPKKSPPTSLHATISGRPLVGRYLTIHVTGHTNIVRYQWQICHGPKNNRTCVLLRGQNGSRILIRNAYLGGTLRAIVSYLSDAHRRQTTTPNTTTVRKP